jgi:outer membrane protein assembly factor BamB
VGGAGPIDARASASTDYPTLGYDAIHSSVSPDTTVGATSWDALTLQHKVSLGGFILSSPAVAYNSSLGKNLVYVVASGAPSISAVDAASGTVIWTEPLAADAYSSPAVYGNTVYFGSEDFNLYAYDATTGQPVCSFSTGGRIEASPVVKDIDGTGPLVFVGDTGRTESHNAGHEWALNGVGNTSGAPCSERWAFNGWNNTNNGIDGGSWSSPALGTDGTGRPLLVFGSNQPDDSVYALDARNGTEVWRFQTVIGSDSDVGAAPTISLPGNNGLADGAVYVMGKDQHEFALNFLTGALLWDYDLSTLPCSSDPVSGTALVGTMVVFNFCKWVYAVNAAPTGPGTTKVIWRSVATAHSRASPVISGGPGDQVVLRPDKGGNEDAFRAANGAMLTPFNVGSTTLEITASTAVSAGEVFFAGVDGNLYILGLSSGTGPVVGGVSPSSGPVAGGTSVTISGNNFSGATGVSFGSAAAAFTINSATQITATSPAGSGTVDVRVTTGAGTSPAVAADQFTYTAQSVPKVTSISPTSGPAAGGTAVTIQGSNLAGASSVTFGGKAAAFTIISDTQINATSPGGKSGMVSVVVHSPAGHSAKTIRFTYV